MASKIGLGQKIVRKHISPFLTRVSSSRVPFIGGRADREKLAAQLCRQMPPKNMKAVVDTLVDRGVLKPAFAAEISSPDKLQPFMLKRAKLKTVDNLAVTTFPELDLDAVFPHRPKLRAGINSSLAMIKRHLLNGNLPAALAFAGALTGAATIYDLCSADTSAMKWVGYSLATLCTTMLVRKGREHFSAAWKMDKPWDEFGLRALTSAGALSTGLSLMYLAHETSLSWHNVELVLDHHSNGTAYLMGTVAALVLADLTTTLFRAIAAYPSKFAPGSFAGIRDNLLYAKGAIYASMSIMALRLVLLGGSLMFIFENGLKNNWSFAPLGIAALGIFFNIALKAGWHKFDLIDPKNSARQWKAHDWLLYYSGFTGLALGALAALGESYGAGSWGPFVAYATVLTTLGSLGPYEGHGYFHSIDTTKGFIRTLLCSSVELIGEKEIQDLVGKDVILMVNPQTSLADFSMGLPFNVFLARKGGLVFLVPFDQPTISANPLFTTGDAGKKYQLEHIEWVKENQRRIYEQLHGPVEPALRRARALFDQAAREPDPQKEKACRITAETELRASYRLLAEALGSLAEYYEKPAVALELDPKFGPDADPSKLLGNQSRELSLLERIELKFRPVFRVKEKVMVDAQEFYRAGKQAIRWRGSEFRAVARRLRRKETSSNISLADFTAEYKRQLAYFHPDLVQIHYVDRKAIEGDDLCIRKEENVNALRIRRAMSLYAGWHNNDTINSNKVRNFPPGEWTAIPNPEWTPGAEPGSLESALYLWVRTDRVLTPFQQEHRDELSDSPVIYSVNNQPAETDGYKQGSRPINASVNVEFNRGRQLTLNPGEYYYDTTENQSRLPRITSLNLRAEDGSKGVAVDQATFRQIAAIGPVDYSQETVRINDRVSLPPYQVEILAAYKLDYFNATPAECEKEMMGRSFVMPAYNYTHMTDKNDINLSTYRVGPAIVARDKQHLYLKLGLRVPYGFWVSNLDLADPHPDKYLLSSDIIDGDIEMIYQRPDGKKRVAPFKINRSALVNAAMPFKPPKSITPDFRAADYSFDPATGRRQCLFISTNEDAIVKIEEPKEDQPPLNGEAQRVNNALAVITAQIEARETGQYKRGAAIFPNALAAARADNGKFELMLSAADLKKKYDLGAPAMAGHDFVRLEVTLDQATGHLTHHGIFTKLERHDQTGQVNIPAALAPTAEKPRGKYNYYQLQAQGIEPPAIAGEDFERAELAYDQATGQTTVVYYYVKAKTTDLTNHPITRYIEGAAVHREMDDLRSGRTSQPISKRVKPSSVYPGINFGSVEADRFEISRIEYEYDPATKKQACRFVFAVPPKNQPEQGPEVYLPLYDHSIPRYIKESLLADEIAALVPKSGLLKRSFQVNDFLHTPHREGDSSWLKLEYTETAEDDSPKTVAFVRIPDGKRPPWVQQDKMKAEREIP